MKITLLKILFGIIGFIIGGTIAVAIVIPLLSNLIGNETVLDVVHIFVTLGVAIILYRLAVKHLLKGNK
jgi:uncharacterized protein YacL